MDQQTYDQRVKAFLADMNAKSVPPEVSASALASMEQADKSAQQQGIAFKSDDPWGAVVAALKAAMAPASMEEAGATEIEDAELEQDDEGDDGEYVGDMSPAAFKSMMGEMLAPVLKMQDMLKGMMGGATTKDDARAQEIASLKARLARLEGDQPAVVSSADVEAALKGGPQAPPDPNAPAIPDDPNRPFAGATARLFPDLYKTNPDGSWAGWNISSTSS